ncbi:MAG: hypothetical protein KAI66_14250, partial [Lentisphaeria bacterium]|nr:hypothetical protein [Lentisphaeria bacterium]
SAIGEQLGPLTISGLDSARSKMMLKMEGNKQLQKKVSQAERILEAIGHKSKSEDLYLSRSATGKV